MKKDFEKLVYYAVKAPSGHNTQPWKFEVEDDRILILPDFERSLPIVDPDNHALFISLGCAAENLIIAAEHFGYIAELKAITTGQGHIEVLLKKDLQPNENPLFEQIEKRQSTRNKYSGEPIPAEHLTLLLKAAEMDNVKCRIITQKEEIEPIIALVKEGCTGQFENPAFVEELAHWIRFNKGIAIEKNDGLSSAVTGNPNVPEWLGKFIMGITISSKKEAKKCEELIRSSSALVVFIGHRDDKESWMNVGRSFERFALMATSLGINNAHENMPCEERPVREKLTRLLKLAGEEQPLLLLRIGYSFIMPYSYRRPVKDVMVKVNELV